MKLITKTTKQPDNAATGAAFRALRLKRGMSLRSLASKLDTSQGYVHDSETGRRGWTAQKLARWLGALK